MKEHAVALLLLAFCCASVFHTRVYKRFDRIRITVLDAERAPADDLLIVSLPDAPRLGGTWTVIVLRLVNRGPNTRSVRITIGTTASDHVILHPNQRSRRVDLAVPWPWNADINRIVLRGDGGDWGLEYVELANGYGFNGGPFGFVIVPDRAVPTHRPSTYSTVVVFFVVLALPVVLRRLGGECGGNTAALAVSAMGLGFLGVMLLLPVVAPYKILLSVQAFWLCVATIYGGLSRGLRGATDSRCLL